MATLFLRGSGVNATNEKPFRSGWIIVAFMSMLIPIFC